MPKARGSGLCGWVTDLLLTQRNTQPECRLLLSLALQLVSPPPPSRGPSPGPGAVWLHTRALGPVPIPGPVQDHGHRTSGLGCTAWLSPWCKVLSLLHGREGWGDGKHSTQLWPHRLGCARRTK